MRPRLRTFIPDVYKDISYVLNEESYAAAEYQDVIRKRFIKTWEQLMDGYKVYHPISVLLEMLTVTSRTYSRRTIIVHSSASWSTWSSGHGRNTSFHSNILRYEFHLCPFRSLTSTPSSVPSVSTATCALSPLTYPHKHNLATFARNSCDSGKSAPSSISMEKRMWKSSLTDQASHGNCPCMRRGRL